MDDLVAVSVIWRQISFDDFLLVARVCAGIASVLSLIHMLRHCCLNKGSIALRFCVYRILALVPIYAVNASSALHQIESFYFLPEFLALFREFYEALVIVSFVQLLMIWMGGSHAVAKAFDDVMQRPQHVWVTIFPSLQGSCVAKAIPMPYLPGIGLVSGILMGIMQFTFVSLFCISVEILLWFFTVIMCYLSFWQQDEAGHFLTSWMKVPAGLRTVSVAWAMYNLLLLFMEVNRNDALRHRFEDLKPEGKFVCIKAIIGLTALQKFLCETVLPFFHVWENLGTKYTPQERESGVQNFLLCCELVIIAVWHFWAYPVGDFSHEDAVLGRSSLDASTLGMMRDYFNLRWAAWNERSALRKLRRKTLPFAEMKDQFQKFDHDRVGNISVKKFEYILERMGASPEHVNAIVEAAGGEDGTIGEEQFARGMVFRASTAGLAEPLTELRAIH